MLQTKRYTCTHSNLSTPIIVVLFLHTIVKRLKVTVEFHDF